jgi:hypothetical protein
LTPRFAVIITQSRCVIGGDYSGESSNATAPPTPDEAPVRAIAQLVPLSFLVPSSGATREENTMQSVLMVSLAVSIVLGIWVIWKLTP